MKNIYLILIICFHSTLAQTQWIQKGTDINGENAEDWSGRNISMSSDGNTLAIGAIKNDGMALDAGHVRVYEWISSTWIQKGADIDGEAEGDFSGYSVSLSEDGNTLAIGAPKNDGIALDAGHVRVYEWSNSDWIQKGDDIDGEAEGDESGWTVSMNSDGNTLAIGAPENDGAFVSAGHVRIYEWNSSNWIQKGADIDGELPPDFSGAAISLSADGNTLAIGAANNDGTESNAGHVRVYEWNNSAWIQKGTDVDGEAAGDFSGSAVWLSTDGNTLAIGAANNDGIASSAGHVRIYEWNSSTWIQKGADIDGEAADDFSGYSVSLSTDGNTLAIGAIKNDGMALDAGHVRVYEWDSSAWIQKGVDIEGEAEGDFSGYSVSLSGDGNTLAIGAMKNDGTALDAGHVRVYQFSEVGIIENDYGNGLLIYPNPTDGDFSIDLGSNYKLVTITMTDVNGKLIQSNTYNESQLLELKLEAPAGVYFLIIESKGKKATIRLMKE